MHYAGDTDVEFITTEMITEAPKEDAITQSEWKWVEMILDMIIRDRQLNRYIQTFYLLY